MTKSRGIRGRKSPVVADVATRTIRIPLSQGKFAIIDATDWPVVDGVSWSYGEAKPGYGYAMAKMNGKTVRMHQIIARAAPGEPVDHRNHDTLDNRRGNLRLCTAAGNGMNARRWSHNTSGYKGVSYDNRLGKWHAYIQLGGKKQHLGLFETRQAAARAYDEAAHAGFGEFACPNFSTERS